MQKEMTEKQAIELGISILKCFQMAYLYEEYKQETPFTDIDYEKIISTLEKVVEKMS